MQLLPQPGRVSWEVSAVGATVHIEHIENEAPTTYWHVQDLVILEGRLELVMGLRPSLGLSLGLPVRMVRDRIKFEDLARAPYVPPTPDEHHRNETLTRIADPRLALQWNRLAPPWTYTASAGVWLPLGRTESNPFALGRAGLPHQHIQFGTGTVDPGVSFVASRRAGGWSWTAAGAARFTLYENTHGYRAGDRYALALQGVRALPGAWAALGGLELANEQAERWDGLLEEEGNIGRTDLFAMIGLARGTGLGTLTGQVRFSIASHVEGAQTDVPVLLRIGLAR